MPSGYAVAIVIGFYPFLISWFWARSGQGRKVKLPRFESRFGIIGWLMDMRWRMYVVEDPGKTIEGIEHCSELLRRSPAPLDIDRLEREKEPPSSLVMESLHGLREAQQRGDGTGPGTIDAIIERCLAPSLREPRKAISAWAALVVLLTAAFAVYPFATHGLTLPGPWGHVSRETAREAAHILLVGGCITFLAALVCLARIGGVWRPVARRWRELLDESAPRLQGGK